ncbi:DUF2884 family protein [Rosenbergiella nectarea]|uniref:DUF2884 family protein n=1 Tax=Rosenbergiella nectarea TaxID=988801 RepID=UPI001BDA0D51|nr:DUF2884 family protein [Rosenbergiella nectarea]MBT0730366.1 DUF2884 family protein [Rosenbergiella nectarea subsp. apis]
MLRKVLLATLLVSAVQAHAAYQCDSIPKDDITLSPQSVAVVGNDGTMVITPNGDITFNGKALQPSAAVRQQAINYQAAVRKDMPWINQGAHQRLDQAKTALDRIITEKLGAESGIHQRLDNLNSQLKLQFARVLSQKNDVMTYHHSAIDSVHQDSEKLVQSAMGGVLQDSLNEMGNMKNLSSNGNPLQALVGNLGGLQQAVQQEWKQHEDDFQQFGQQVCQRVTQLEKQRIALYNSAK